MVPSKNFFRERIAHFLAGVIALSASAAFAQTITESDEKQRLPDALKDGTAEISPERYPVLRKAMDSEFQAQFETQLAKSKLDKAVQSGKLSLTLVDITDLSHPRMAHVNGEKMFYAASLPKIAILLAAAQKIEDGELTLDKSLKAQLTRMIRNSSNVDATRTLNLVGGDYINDLLASDRYKLYDVDYDGGLWVGKAYGPGAAFHRDPLHNISHGASGVQVARFYYQLATGQLVSPTQSALMKEVLSKPAINHKFVRGLRAYKPKSEIYRKSGTWRTYNADSAIVERDGRSYIAVGLANSAQGGEWLSDAIVVMDKLVFSTRPRTISAALGTSD